MSTFTRNEFASILSSKLDIPVDRAKGIVDNVLDILGSAMLESRKIEFRNFGLFEVVQRKPKIGRNPLKPNEGQYQIPARKVVRFKIGKELFEKLNPDQ